MSRNKVYGKCRICGKEGKLTFEHIPPRATFNKQSARVVKLMDLIKAENEDDAYPWELDQAAYTISQRGLGEYCLCEKCNNDTGAWYGVHYKRFIDALMFVYINMKKQNKDVISVELKDMRPLPIIKQIFAMFCDINHALADNDTSIREFLLNKESNVIDRKKYRLFMYVMKGDFEKTVGFTAQIRLGQPLPLMLSEIATIPVGFILYKDLPNDFETNLTEITSFLDCDYSSIRNIQMPITALEVNSWIPGDFRSKKEIAETIEQSKKWRDENNKQ